MKGAGPPAPAPVVAAVVQAEIARLGLGGAVLASPPGPESELLRRWLAPLTALRVPDAGAVADLAGALAAAGAPGHVLEALAWRAAAEALAHGEGLLPLGSTNKTQLLLDPAPLPARVLPLGDVWASAVRAAVGSAALPPALAGAGPQLVAEVEAALASYLEGGVAPDRAFGPLGSLGHAAVRALNAAEKNRRGLLVPKLGPWTVGCDLAR